MMNKFQKTGQHFLLSANARTISVAEVARMTEDEAFTNFKNVRWEANGGEPICHHCGSIECWSFKTRRIFKCKHCEKQFSVTTGTIFANRKLPMRDYLLAIALFTNSHKGMSALQLSRDLGVQYKTAYVLAHKIRESIQQEVQELKLSGEIEVDGAYFGGYLKPANNKENRIDRRKAKYQNGKRRCVFVIRERGGRTLPVIIKSESTSSVLAAMRNRIKEGSTVHADENAAYDSLSSLYNMKRINHSECYSSEESCTNSAEGWFSRLRRGEIGQFHHVSGKYLHAYANEMAYREDYRRRDNGTVLIDLTNKCLSTRTSRNWCGYWQGNKQDGEIIIKAAS